MDRGLLVFLISLLALPAVAFAQAAAPPPISPTPITPFLSQPHPTMPWFGPAFPGRANYGVVPDRPPLAQDVAFYGTVIGYMEVPPQPVEIQVYVPGPGSVPGEFQLQIVEIPGYVITETTTGYLYPERWGIEQPTAGVYQWRLLPKFFTRK